MGPEELINFFMRLIKESCVETYDEAMNAEIRGADRIELCSRLDLDGLTPSKELVKRLVSDLTIPIKVMVRPRKVIFAILMKRSIKCIMIY